MTVQGLSDLAIVIVGFRSAKYLDACLRTLAEHAGDLDVDTVVVDNDGLAEVGPIAEVHGARTIASANHGFAHGNNQGLAVTNARHVLFINPDTEILDGSLADLVAELDRQTHVGLVGVIQVDPDGALIPTIRRFPSVATAIGDSLGAERIPARPSWLGERELDLSRYGSRVACDWVSGSFMLVRREALTAAGVFDERFFLFSEEIDLAHRIKSAGFAIEHWPTMRILHHTRKASFSPALEAQVTLSRRLYAEKHLSRPRRAVVLAALGLGQLLRSELAHTGGEERGARRAAARSSLRALLRGSHAPFEPPPRVAVRPDVIDGFGGEPATSIPEPRTAAP
jgi:GT2 family glycosyltransferase